MDLETRLFKAAALRALSDEQLAQTLSGCAEGTGNFWLCQMEFTRRHQAANELRGWVGLFISGFAFVISVFALFAQTK